MLWAHALRNSLTAGPERARRQPLAPLRRRGGHETVFALPGVGILLVDSILSRDFPVVQGVIVVVTVGVFLTNLLVELGYGLVDPRVRHE